MCNWLESSSVILWLESGTSQASNRETLVIVVIPWNEKTRTHMRSIFVNKFFINKKCSFCRTISRSTAACGSWLLLFPSLSYLHQLAEHHLKVGECVSVRVAKSNLVRMRFVGHAPRAGGQLQVELWSKPWSCPLVAFGSSERWSLWPSTK